MRKKLSKVRNQLIEAMVCLAAADFEMIGMTDHQADVKKLDDTVDYIKDLLFRIDREIKE